MPNRLRLEQRRRQSALFRAADLASTAAGRAIAGLWRELLAVLRTTRGYTEDVRRVAAVLRRVGPVTADVLRERLAGLYFQGHGGAVASVRATLSWRVAEAVQRPVHKIGRALTTRADAEYFAHLLRGAVEVASEDRTGAGMCNDAAIVIKQFFPEAENYWVQFQGPSGPEDHNVAQVGRWFIDVTADQFGREKVNVTDRLDPALYANMEPAPWSAEAIPKGSYADEMLLHLAREGHIPVPDAPDLGLDLIPQLLPAPAEEDVFAWLSHLVRPLDYALIGTDSDRRIPDDLARSVALDMSQGKTQREIARNLRPHLDGSHMRARRAARTLGLVVAHAAQRQAWEELGDMLIGYEVIHTQVPDSRPWHTARAGRKYYFDPTPGQDGMAKCPHPPEEPADPSERPAKAPKIAWNCLCALVPILRVE